MSLWHGIAWGTTALPVVPPAVWLVRRHAPSRDAAIIAGALALSLVVDLAGGLHLRPTWPLARFYVVAQATLVVWALRGKPWATLAAAALTWLAVVSLLQGPRDGPETVTWTSAALLVVLLAWPRRDAVGWALLVYFGLGGLARLAWPLLYEGPGFVVGWCVYQGSRAFGLACLAVEGSRT